MNKLNDYGKRFVEVDEILNRMPQKDFNKIPREIIKKFHILNEIKNEALKKQEYNPENIFKSIKNKKENQ